MQQTCYARGVDTPDPLLRSSLRAMRAQQPDAKFMLVSGDLVAHAFSCRYKTLFPHATPAEYQSFVEKTIRYVVGQLRATFPRIPIYVALGNNDSACGDYRLDAGNTFLADTAQIVATGLPASDRAAEIQDFSQNGSYSLTMAPPMQNTRLIVLDDLFLSKKYRSCAGKPDAAPADAEIAWLRDQLAQARQSGQKVWIMGHIPTGIDPYATARRLGAMCGHVNPVMFLSSNKLADLLIEYADIIRLGIFAHTHMDEIRLLQPEPADPDSACTRRRHKNGSVHFSRGWKRSFLHHRAHQSIVRKVAGLQGRFRLQPHRHRHPVVGGVRLCSDVSSAGIFAVHRTSAHRGVRRRSRRR